MATVPYQGFATERPSAPETPQIRETVTADMFGGNVGQAMERLGATEGQVGNELFQRALALQQLNNENNARAAQNEYSEQAGLIQAKFDAQEGTNASPDALKAHLQELHDLRTQIRGGLKTTDAQVYYDRDTSSLMTRLVISSAGHAQAQMKEVTTGNALAKLNIIQKTWTGTPGEMEEKIRESQDPIATYGAIKGWTPAQIDDFTRTHMSILSREQIEHFAKDNPQLALEMIDKNQALPADDPRRMAQKDMDHAMETARTRNLTIGAPNLARDIYDPEKTMEQMRDEAAKRSAVIAHGDDAFEPAVESHLATMYSRQKTFKAADDRETISMLEQKVRGNPDITQQELLDPNMQQRVNALSDPKARAWINGGKWLEQTQILETYKNQQDTLKGLLGLARSDNPKDVDKFLSTDFTQQKLSQDNQNKLRVERERVLKEGRDPHYTQALRTMFDTYGSKLSSLGVVQGTPQYDKDTKLMYEGAMAIAIDEWRQDHKGVPPSAQEVKEIIGPDVIRQTTTPGFFFGTNTGPPAFNPDMGTVRDWATKAGIDKEFTDKNNGTPPDDSDLRRMYLMKQFMDLYAKKTPNAGSAGTAR